jgi:outer membrane protein W
MMRRFMLAGLLVSSVAFIAPAKAHADQMFSFSVGYFSLRGEDIRAQRDVLLDNVSFLDFEIRDFNGANVGGEWLFRFSDYFEAGVGLGYYGRTVPSVYRGYVNIDGSEIAQDLRLRVVPVTGTVRLLPLGRDAGIQPYVGAGLGIYSWRYSEAGEFVDFDTFEIFRDRFADSGTSAGPVLLAGIRLWPSRNFGVGGELRYQRARGDLDPQLFPATGDRIDLGGTAFNATMVVRF